jgi:hypothetical protein
LQINLQFQYKYELNYQIHSSLSDLFLLGIFAVGYTYGYSHLSLSGLKIADVSKVPK